MENHFSLQGKDEALVCLLFLCLFFAYSDWAVCIITGGT